MLNAILPQVPQPKTLMSLVSLLKSHTGEGGEALQRFLFLKNLSHHNDYVSAFTFPIIQKTSLNDVSLQAVPTLLLT